LDTDNPQFFPRLEACASANEKLTAIANNQAPKLVKFCQKMPWIGVIVWQMVCIFLQKPVDAEARRGMVC
jgi:magnesium-protoporphyrin IX monomethyl ester (oxidative) cyclase